MRWIKRSLVSKLSIFLIISLFSIKLFDSVIGFLQSSETDNTIKRSLLLKEHPPNLNTYMEPSSEYMKNTQNFVQKKFLVRTDRDGFIVGPKDFDDTSSEVGLIFFGGSTTECIYVEEEKRFPYLVSESLGVRVLNSGVAGNHSIHSLFAMIGKGIPYKPKHMVLMHAVNDLTLLSKTLSYWDAPQTRALVQLDDSTKISSISWNIARQIKSSLITNLWLKTRHLFHAFLMEARPDFDEWLSYRTTTLDYASVERALTKQFTASLKSFIHVSRSWGIEPILMTQFNRFKNEDVFIRESYEKVPQPISYDEFVRLYKTANDIARAVAKEENVYLIDLDKMIPSTQEYIYDAVHLNSKGSELVSEKIINSLKSRYPSVYR